VYKDTFVPRLQSPLVTAVFLTMVLAGNGVLASRWLFKLLLEQTCW